MTQFIDVLRPYPASRWSGNLVNVSMHKAHAAVSRKKYVSRFSLFWFMWNDDFTHGGAFLAHSFEILSFMHLKINQIILQKYFCKTLKITNRVLFCWSFKRVNVSMLCLHWTHLQIDFTGFSWMSLLCNHKQAIRLCDRELLTSPTSSWDRVTTNLSIHDHAFLWNIALCVVHSFSRRNSFSCSVIRNKK